MRAAPRPAATVFVSAGEASGDLAAAEVVAEIRRRAPRARVVGYGGDALRAAGVEIRADFTRRAAVGLTEVARQFWYFYGLLHGPLPHLLRDVRPDVAMLTDFGGFHLQAAKIFRYLGIPVVYYVSPQVWASRAGRVQAIRHVVSKMLVVFDFEREIYERAGVPVEFVGHPLLDRLAKLPDGKAAMRRAGLDPRRRLVVLLPGSRVGEVERLLPAMVQAAAVLRREDPTLQFAIPVAATLEPEPIRRASASVSAAVVSDADVALGVRRAAAVAVVASGTATLETALLGTPQVIVYRVSRLTYEIGKRLVRIPDIGLVNVVAGSRVVPELVQSEATPERIATDVRRLLADPRAAAAQRAAYREVRAKLGHPGAAKRAAEAVLAFTT